MRPGRAADHSPPSSAAVMEQYSYTSTHPLGHTGPVTGSLYFIYIYIVLHMQLVGSIEEQEQKVTAIRVGAGYVSVRWKHPPIPSFQKS